MKKNGKMGTGALFGVLAVILLVIIVGMFAVYNQVSKEPTSATGADIELIELSSKSEFCANNPGLDFKVRIQDSLQDTSVSYMNATLYIKNMDTGSITESSVTTGGTSAFTTIQNAFNCVSVLGYDIVKSIRGD